MSKKIVQLNEEVIKGQIKELARRKRGGQLFRRQLPLMLVCARMRHVAGAQ